MLIAASKTRPALVSARSSFHASSGSGTGRAASTISASSDIFDVPGRLIFDDEPTTNSSLSAARRYYPSHFRPIQVQSSAPARPPSPGPAAHRSQQSQQSQTHAHVAQARQMSTLAHQRISNDGSSILFDGPARPRHPPRVTSRHDHSRAASCYAKPLNVFEGVDMKNYVPPTPPPEPLLFDGPAQPRRLKPAQVRKSSQNGGNGNSSAAVGALAGIVGLGGAYEIYEAHQDSKSTPRNILSYSRSRESVATQEPVDDTEEAEAKYEMLRDEVLPNVF